MKTIQNNIERIKTLENQIWSNEMVSDISFKEAGKILFILSNPLNGIDGIRVSLGNGKAWAYEKAIETLNNLKRD